MTMQRLLLGGGLAATLSWAMAATPVLAQDQLYVPLLTYRTGAFAGSGIPIADGMLGLPDRPGLGTRLQDGFETRPNARVEVTTEATLKAW